ncbi:MAG: beta-ketoacyl-ACP synthase [Roseitalea porphyridii]|uniref:beta-ketoacyl-ACP synthase n=1 Tax=Roseitalea porphyridii TaxID=1852022 RepID=UPI0032F07E24
MTHKNAVITGIGLISGLGVGAQANWQALAEGRRSPVDTERFSPYPVHPAPEIDWSGQIPRRGDQRQMEPWQRLGTFAAGLALDDAAIKGDEALTGTMDMIVAAAGGERDIAVDTMILAGVAGGRNDADVLVNEVLTSELRPTLFLAQLSNLLAGNISIVHKVTGSSRTFMGEEGAGMSALETAVARICAGQSPHALVGAAYNCEHPDMLLGFETGQLLMRGDWRPVAERDGAEGGGIVPGSGAVFLVIEEQEHAAARGARGYARIGPVATDAGDPAEDKVRGRLERLAERSDIGRADMVVSAASGVAARGATERAFLADRCADKPARVIANLTGHLREAQFPLAVAAGALALANGATIAPTDSATERAADGAPSAVGVIGLGHASAEAMVLLERAGDTP